MPVDDVLISAKVLFEKNGNLLVSLEIKVGAYLLELPHNNYRFFIAVSTIVHI